ncbi:hypothetical protein ITJ55_00290 [Frigoribacterium sp. VKM Ac-1396]|uniref:hypothetical protein n=1 Tax=Frigoribacterium sp. VKM Ac-1396 TaxID=2783821 RepID=UPI00188C009B|nr:hypothetical protein [Frigoribacterium sp. VKM Ac-1396]MBF4599240.1 hypothetical protein [Frigoribacterium sp. VKM Ac-1396]
MSTPPSPGGTDALFGVVQTALTIGSAIPLLLSVVALVLYVRTRRRLASESARARRSDDHTRRLHDLARVSLLGSAFGLVLLLIGQLVVALGTTVGPAAAFAGPLAPVTIGAAVLTALAAGAFATSPAPPAPPVPPRR